jgi:hypothetical protein
MKSTVNQEGLTSFLLFLADLHGSSNDGGTDGSDRNALLRPASDSLPPGTSYGGALRPRPERLPRFPVPAAECLRRARQWAISGTQRLANGNTRVPGPRCQDCSR